MSTPAPKITGPLPLDPNEPKARKIFVQLGRAGDILNVLPLAELAFVADGERPWFMVAAAYASLLDAAPYVEPVIYPGEFEEVIIALQQARRLTPAIVLTQIYGAGIKPRQLCTSFARESWWASGIRIPWGSLPLNLWRNREREARLVNEVLGSDAWKRVILVAVDGTSSPFPYAKKVLSELPTFMLGDSIVINLGSVRAENFVDLLALYDRAALLITIDTGHLHLAHASTVPVIAFVTRDPSPWHGSPWRPNQVRRFYYDEMPACWSKFLYEVLNYSAGTPRRRPKIIHVWSDWRTGDPSVELRGRTEVAHGSWEVEYATGQWLPAEMPRSAAKRDGTILGDPHNVSFVHDVVEFAAARAESGNDIICLTNADTGFTPGLTAQILEVVERSGAAFSHRRDFGRIEVAPFSEAQVVRGDWYPGTDLFVFTLAWWRQHKDEYGDFVMGREFWDETLRQLIKYHQGGALLTACWHEWHVSFWCDANRDTLPGNVHNRALRAKWFEATGFVPEDFRYFRTVEEGAIHPPPLK